MQPNTPDPRDTLSLRGWADAALWAAGASILLAAALLSCRLALQFHQSTALLALFISLFVPFIVASRSRRGGLLKALLYIPVILSLPFLAKVFGLYGVWGCWLRDPAGHALGLFGILGLASILPPIALGAFAGWALRRWRGSL